MKNLLLTTKNSNRDLGRIKPHPRTIATVVSWNNYNDTKESLDSLLSSESHLFALAIVDNGSQDGSVKKLKRTFSGMNNIHFILNDRNLGFAAGVNVGIRFALEQGADAVFLLNNDAVVGEDCVARLIAATAKDSSVGIAGPRIFYYKDPQRIWQGGGSFSRIRTGVMVSEKNKLAGECDEENRQATFLTGCAMLIKREVFESIGFFDENYFLYQEDLDFCLRTSRAGFKVLYVPSAKVWHKIGAITKDRTSPFVSYHMARSRILMLCKNFSWPYFLYGLFIHLLLYTPFRFLQILRGSRSLKSMWAWVHGTWAGLYHLLGRRSRCNRSGGSP